MTAIATLLAGGRLTAQEIQDVAPNAAVKPGDESVTDSAALQNDNDLFLVLPATGTFAFIAALYCQSTVAQGSGDIKMAFTWPAGASSSWSTLGNAASSGAGVSMNAVRNTSGASLSCGVGATEVPVVLFGTIVMGGTAGDLQLEWAQNTAAASQSITVKAQSWLIAWQIA